jgi:hypothetical protein
MVMELIRATSRKGGFSFIRGCGGKYLFRYLLRGCAPVAYSPLPFSPMNHCSLFLNNTLKVVKEP